MHTKRKNRGGQAVAKLKQYYYGDLINVVNEEDEDNNLAKRTFERRESFGGHLLEEGLQRG